MALSGFGRLDDNDFSPIGTGPGPNGLIAWSRVAVLQTLDRLSDRSQSKNPDSSALVYDVVFCGPGGELVPTVQASETGSI